MVDSTSGIGQVPGITATNKTQNSQNKRSESAQEASKSSAPQDEVQISEEALSLAQAEEAVSEIQRYLQENQDTSLGLDPSFDRSVLEDV